MTAPPCRACVITVSDRVSRGAAEDLGGPLLERLLRDAGVEVVSREVVPDDRARLRTLLVQSAATHDLVVTTGGTGLGPRDLTPEATLEVIERRVPGMEEAMRAAGREKTPLAMLSRGVVGARGAALILNLPGSPRGIEDGLGAVLPTLAHAVALLRASVRDCAPARAEFEG